MVESDTRAILDRLAHLERTNRLIRRLFLGVVILAGLVIASARWSKAVRAQSRPSDNSELATTRPEGLLDAHAIRLFDEQGHLQMILAASSKGTTLKSEGGLIIHTNNEAMSAVLNDDSLSIVNRASKSMIRLNTGADAAMIHLMGPGPKIGSVKLMAKEDAGAVMCQGDSARTLMASGSDGSHFRMTRHEESKAGAVKQGKGEVGMSLLETGVPGFYVAGPTEGEVSIGVNPNATPFVNLKDRTNATRMLMSVNEDGPSLELTDSSGQPRATIGHADLKIKKSGSIEKRAVSSLVLFDESGRAVWTAP